MFKPVAGDQLEQFDPETRELFSRRYHEPRVTFALMNFPRRARQHLPFYIDRSNELVQEQERQYNQYWWKFLLAFGVFSFAMN